MKVRLQAVEGLSDLACVIIRFQLAYSSKSEYYSYSKFEKDIEELTVILWNKISVFPCFIVK